MKTNEFGQMIGEAVPGFTSGGLPTATWLCSASFRTKKASSKLCSFKNNKKDKITEGFLLPFGCLHSKGNNCTGKSQGLFAYRTSKGVKLIHSTDALIHFGYTRYFHYYRIQKVPEALFRDYVRKVELRNHRDSHFPSFIKSTGYFKLFYALAVHFRALRNVKKYWKETKIPRFYSVNGKEEQPMWNTDSRVKPVESVWSLVGAKT